MNIKNRKEHSDFIFNVYRTSIDCSYWGYVLEKLSSYVNGKASIASIDNHSGHTPIDIFTTKTYITPKPQTTF